MTDQMTADEFRTIRHNLPGRPSQATIAEVLGVKTQTVKRWEASANAANARQIDPTAAQVMRWMRDGYMPPGYPNPVAH